MIKTLSSSFCIIALLSIPPVYADIEVSFIESAPKDRFVIKNVGECGLNGLVVDMDLASSEGKLIFDTTAKDEGVEVFQPFEVTEGELELISSEEVKDGDDTLSLAVKQLGVDQVVSFTIDVDDTLPKSVLGKIRVADSEIMGGSVQVKSSDIQTVNATFDSSSRAILKLPSCV